MRGGSFQPEECTASDCVQSPSSTSRSGRSPLQQLLQEQESRSGELRSGFDFVLLGYFRICHLLIPIASCAQAFEVLEEARLNRCAIWLQRNGEELVARDTAVGRVLDHRADCITQWIIVRARRDSDITPAQKVIDVAGARDDGSDHRGPYRFRRPVTLRIAYPRECSMPSV